MYFPSAEEQKALVPSLCFEKPAVQVNYLLMSRIVDPGKETQI
jgi:hypothetical protein